MESFVLKQLKSKDRFRYDGGTAHRTKIHRIITALAAADMATREEYNCTLKNKILKKFSLFV